MTAASRVRPADGELVLAPRPRLDGSKPEDDYARVKNDGDPTKSEEASLYGSGTSPDLIATVESVYDGPFAAEYAPCDKWENLANFDPSFRWTYAEEAKVRRKVDWKIYAWVLVIFLALDIDRGNLSNATADNLLDDLNITQDDYNLAITVQRIAFLLAELPSQMIGKAIGVDVWLPIQITCFSVFAMAQCWMKTRASFIALRFCVALFQGGLIADVVLYTSYWYTSAEMPLRIGLFFTTNFYSVTITSFAAVGLLKMRGICGYTGWQWMFLIEGIFTFCIGVASFFMMAPSPSQTKAKWRPNGYFTDREVKIIVNRVIRDEPQKGEMHNRQALSPRLLWKSLADYDMIPFYGMGLLFEISTNPVSNYFQLSMKSLGFSTAMANLLAVPYTVLGIIFLLGLVALSEAVNNRVWVCMIEQVWLLPLFIALRTLPDLSPWTAFTISTLCLAVPYAHAVQVSWIARNSGSVRTRTVSAALYNMSDQIDDIIGANLYVASDAPRYFRANTVCIILICVNIVFLYPGLWLYYTLRNRHKEKLWNAMTEKEQKHYLATTTDEGNRRLDFRFVLVSLILAFYVLAATADCVFRLQ
ncbi:hypothetical protein JCM8097_006445 [Rhodosporidiobolus ruineniae]